MYWTPKRLKELKERGYKLHSSPSSLVKKSDQVISETKPTGDGERAPGQGLKPQATEASSIKPKRQASSKASSIKPTERQASSD